MSAASKRAAKRKAKKEEEAILAAVSAVEQITSTMSVAGASTAAAAITHTGEQKSASSTVAAAAAAEPAAPVSTDPRVVLKEKGNRAFGEKNMAGAIRFFTEAIDFSPVTEDTDAAAAKAAAVNGSTPFVPPFLASVHSNRSAAYAACYEWNAALADADRAIKLAPKWAKGHYRRGQALEGLMKYDAARAAYAEGAKVDPNDLVLQRQLEKVSSIITEVNTVTAEEASENPESDIWVQLIDWLLQGKSRFPNLYLKYYSEDYRGVHSHGWIHKDDIVLEVPLSHIMTSEVAKASDIGQRILNSGVDLNSTHTYLSCYLLQERRNPNSFWTPYIKCLPVHYRNMPIFFTNEELAYLKGSFSLGKIADRHAELKEEYDNLIKHVPHFDEYSLEEFVWARSVVITRIFGLMISGTKTDGLVPMADMLNHRRPRETAWTYDDARGSFTITALKDMHRGEQIYDSYGRKCNSRFFVNYGFSLEQNDDNQAVIWLALPESDPHFSMKTRMLGNTKIGAGGASAPHQPKRFQIPTDYTEEVTKECFSFLRFVHAKDSELLLLSSNDKFDVKKIEPISLRNELEVITDLSIAARTSLTQFESSTVEEDNRILADPKTSQNVRNAVLMRRGEKLVLKYYEDMLAEVKPLIEMPWTQFKKHVAKMIGAKPGRFDEYINAVIVPLKKAGH